MNKKQKKMLIRIAITAVMLIALAFIPLTGIWQLLAYVAAYLVIGYDILRKAGIGIIHGRAFDECFLMAIATLGAFYAEKIATEIEAGNLPNDIDTVFGPAYKGIPLGVSTAIALTASHGMEVGYTFDRKEKKDHGDGGMMVGTQHVNYHSDENRAVKSTIGFFRKK